MESVLTLVFGVMVPLVPLFFVLRYAKRKSAERVSLFAALAERRGGEVPALSWYQHLPKWRFEREGRTHELRYYSTGGKHPILYTEIETALPEPQALLVYTETALSGLGRLLGFQDIQVGDPEFDAAFVVKCKDPGTARAVLHGHVCAAMLALRNAGHEKLTAQWKNGKLLVRRIGFLESVPELEAFVDLALPLLDAFARAR